MQNDDAPLKPSPETVMLEEAMERHGMPEALRDQALHRLLLADGAIWSRAKFIATIEGMAAQMSRQNNAMHGMRATLDAVTIFYHGEAEKAQKTLDTAFGEIRRLKKAGVAKAAFGFWIGVLLSSLIFWLL